MQTTIITMATPDIKPIICYTTSVFYTYLAECADQTLYCGITTDILRRELEHNTSQKGAKYTASRRPVTILYYEEFSTKSEALKREYAIKKMSKDQKAALCKTTN